MSGAGDGLDRVRELMMRVLDEELDADERDELERLLASDPELREEWDRLGRLKEVTSNMSMRKPPEEMWSGYWTSVYSRFERGLAWILVSVGAIVLGSYGAWYFVRDLMADGDMPLLVKWSVLALIVGIVILLVSVLRHRLFVSRSDPYKEIER